MILDEYTNKKHHFLLAESIVSQVERTQIFTIFLICEDNKYIDLY